jgi:hypothetical protein
MQVDSETQVPAAAAAEPGKLVEMRSMVILVALVALVFLLAFQALQLFTLVVGPLQIERYWAGRRAESAVVVMEAPALSRWKETAFLAQKTPAAVVVAVMADWVLPTAALVVLAL